MGSVIRSRVINIFEIPAEIVRELVGSGFRIDENGKLAVDCEICEEHSFEFTAQTNSSLWLDGSKVMLTKEFTTYRVRKNRHGHVVNIVPGESWESTDEVLISDYTASALRSVRHSDEKHPNFYKKQD